MACRLSATFGSDLVSQVANQCRAHVVVLGEAVSSGKAGKQRDTQQGRQEAVLERVVRQPVGQQP